jgi:TonB family protein
MARSARMHAGLGGLLITVWLAVAGCASHGAKPTTVILDAGATIPPQVVRQAKLEIPAELIGRSCTSGTTVVEVQVGATGRVQDARVQQASHEPAFDAACVRSAQASEYRPATSHGEPTLGVTKIECKLACP